jgi:hypothetical protein
MHNSGVFFWASIFFLGLWDGGTRYLPFFGVVCSGGDGGYGSWSNMGLRSGNWQRERASDTTASNVVWPWTCTDSSGQVLVVSLPCTACLTFCALLRGRHGYVCSSAPETSVCGHRSPLRMLYRLQMCSCASYMAPAALWGIYGGTDATCVWVVVMHFFGRTTARAWQLQSRCLILCCSFAFLCPLLVPPSPWSPSPPFGLTLMRDARSR